jgi:hypothetical protein
MDQNKKGEQDQKLPEAGIGNASNPSPHNKAMDPVSDNQLLDERAEKYLRESANIEDEPDPQDQQDADETLDNGNQQP